MARARMKWEVVVIAPFVAALILAALWLSVFGAWADIRFAHFVSQVYTVVSVARDVKMDITADAGQVTDALWNRLSELGEAKGGNKASHAVKNPWDDDIRLTMVPVSQQLWMETTVPAQVCHQTLTFVDKNKVVIGVRRVLLREVSPLVDWRQLYEGPDPQKGVIDPLAMQAWCKDRDRPMVIGLLLQLQ